MFKLIDKNMSNSEIISNLFKWKKASENEIVQMHYKVELSHVITHDGMMREVTPETGVYWNKLATAIEHANVVTLSYLAEVFTNETIELIFSVIYSSSMSRNLWTREQKLFATGTT